MRTDLVEAITSAANAPGGSLAQAALVIARVEMGLTYPELAAATGKPSAGAARMAVSRALLRLSEDLGADPVA